MIQSTSREAYHELHDLGTRQQEVLRTINELGTACNLEISQKLGKPINSITPRTNELVDAGLVEISHKAPCVTGRTVIYWTLSEYGEKLFGHKQFEMFDIRREYQ